LLRSGNVPPQIVFEGNALADPSDNPSLKELISRQSWPETCTVPKAWLGSAVAIKDPTSATFLRQNGSNLLLVGHREEAALGVMANSLISLAAQHAPGEKGEKGTDPNCLDGPTDLRSPPDASHKLGLSPIPRFYILDGIRADAPEAGLWNRVQSALPHAVKIANPRETVEVLKEISAELALRQEQAHEYGQPIYLLIYNLARFRDLRKDEDYSFSSMDDSKQANPAKQFYNILREGPPLGIHTILWCDTYNNVSRFLDRQSLRDFEMRVLFQMNPTDSSNLMDTPEASRLGIHVAILYDEGQGRMEKFRPYGLPSKEWLALVKSQLPS
jgi:DNA segregation ATPase FtsK/SpoIIIE, S-DNA-T family